MSEQNEGTEAPALPQLAAAHLRLEDLLAELADRAGVISEAAERLRVLLEVVLAVGTGLDLASLLRSIVEGACRLTDARYGALGVISPEGNHLSDFVTVGVSDEVRAGIGPEPEGHGILGLLIRDPRPLRLRDLTEHPDSYGFPPNHPPMTSFLGVPVRVRDEIFGNLYLCEKEGAPEFSQIDEELVGALAIAAGIAIENARLYRDRDLLARLADRERIARNLHDTVIQRLFAVGMMLQAIVPTAGNGADRDRLMQAVDEIDETIREIRTSIFALESHQHSGLRTEIVELVQEVAGRADLEPHVTFDGTIDAGVAPDVAVDLMAVLREALSNVVRHADASTVDVRVTATEGLELCVGDDGRGIPARPERWSGLGNLGRRAENHGGSLSVAPRPGGGTLLRWWVPGGRGD